MSPVSPVSVGLSVQLSILTQEQERSRPLSLQCLSGCLSSCLYLHRGRREVVPCLSSVCRAVCPVVYTYTGAGEKSSPVSPVSVGLSVQLSILTQGQERSRPLSLQCLSGCLSSCLYLHRGRREVVPCLSSVCRAVCPVVYTYTGAGEKSSPFSPVSVGLSVQLSILTQGQERSRPLSLQCLSGSVGLSVQLSILTQGQERSRPLSLQCLSGCLSSCLYLHRGRREVVPCLSSVCRAVCPVVYTYTGAGEKSSPFSPVSVCPVVYTYTGAGEKSSPFSPVSVGLSVQLSILTQGQARSRPLSLQCLSGCLSSCLYLHRGRREVVPFLSSVCRAVCPVVYTYTGAGEKSSPFSPVSVGLSVQLSILTQGQERSRPRSLQCLSGCLSSCLYLHRGRRGRPRSLQCLSGCLSSCLYLHRGRREVVPGLSSVCRSVCLVV